MVRPYILRKGVATLMDIKGGQAAIGLGIGNVYRVLPSTETYYNQFVADYQDEYSDGTSVVHTTVQSALDACVAWRNDYVIVQPTDGFSIATALTMSKAHVHLICPSGLRGQAGFGAAYLFQTGAAEKVIEISAKGCEVAGFQFLNYVNVNHILIDSGGHNAWIHDNFFHLRGSTTEGVAAIQTGSGVYYTLIVHNNFQPSISGITFASVIAIDQSDNGWSKVTDNSILISDGCTATIGIKATGYKAEVSRNIVAELPVSGGAGAGTVTTCIVYDEGAIAVDNRLCVANTADLSGGGTNTAQNNISGASGGAISG